MEVLYVSKLSSTIALRNIFERYRKNPGFAVQKFSRLIVSGLIKNNIRVNTLSSLPIGFNRIFFVRRKSEVEDGINYNYIPFINLIGLKQLCLVVYSFFYVLFWGLRGRNCKFVFFDVLDISMCVGGLIASKIIGIKSIGIVTDLPNLLLRGGQELTLIHKITNKLNNSFIGKFSSYVFLTEQMNDVVNKQNKPYIVMEGLADSNMKNMNLSVDKSNPKIIMYAGGLYERYGLKMLVEAFVKLGRDDWKLVIYGHGTYVDELKKISQTYSNVVYMGVVANDEVVKAELSASLLVNPRPTHEEFTKYSFPSKNIEYMVSGTPLLTTKLPGMPREYHRYIYVFDEETTDGYAETMKRIFDMPEENLKEKGRDARAFILSKKNNIIQSNRIVHFVKKI